MNYKVRAVAYVLGCTPDLIYSHFKDLKSPIVGGLTEEQLDEIITHMRKPRKAFKNKMDDIKRVQLYVNSKTEQQGGLDVHL